MNAHRGEGPKPRRLLSPAGRLAIGGLMLACLATCAPDRAEEATSPVVEASPEPRRIDGEGGVEPPPAAAGAMAPHLATGDDDSLLLSWLEPEGDGHRLRMARHAGDAGSGEGWGEATTIAAGTDFFANWADVPSVVADGAGDLYAHWLTALGSGTYAYGVQLARSRDGGGTWQTLGLLHDDRSPTEHGFVTLVPVGSGVEAVWLDGRAMAGGGAMTLRTRRVGAAGEAASREAEFGDEVVVDEQVCECCSTAAVETAEGLVVAYRDRSDEEVRDISVTRRDAAGWSPPRVLHRDDWTIPGCPVNGPALAAAGNEVAVAWFTAAEGAPRVLTARSRDGGAEWSAPVEVDAESPLGRVGIALAPGGDAVVSWLAADGGVRLRRVGAGGLLGPPVVLAVTATSRASGVPRLVAAGGMLHVVWVEATEEGPRRLRYARLSPDAVPEV